MIEQNEAGISIGNMVSVNDDFVEDLLAELEVLKIRLAYVVRTIDFLHPYTNIYIFRKYIECQNQFSAIF